MADMAMEVDQDEGAPLNVVENPTLDLDQYIAAYSGPTRIRRLFFIESKCPTLAIDALRLAIRDLKTSPRASEYQSSTHRLASMCENNNATAEPLPSQADIDSIISNSNATIEKLENALKKAQADLMKESIRRCFMDIGDHYFSMADYDNAYNRYLRCRDHHTTSAHVVTMCIKAIKCAVEKSDWLNVHTHVGKAETALDGKKNEKVVSRLKCYSGLAHLAQGEFTEAARHFLNANFDYCAELSDFISQRDIAIYGGLCALAAYDRNRLQSSVMDNKSFKEFLELVPQVRELLKAFCSSRYAKCLNLLNTMKSDLLLDIYLEYHINDLYERIREKALVQYFSPFLSVDMNKMAESFNCSVKELEKDLIKLISKGKIQARIDSDKKILHARTVNKRTSTFAEAMQLADYYDVHSKGILLRAAMMRNNLMVRAGKDRHMHSDRGRMHDEYLQFP
eukprot:m.8438 g.8438  ORF g.8438 m.8438 type:complete len:452 (-) comp3892_c0_seq1:126-1481(-)